MTPAIRLRRKSVEFFVTRSADDSVSQAAKRPSCFSWHPTHRIASGLAFSRAAGIRPQQSTQIPYSPSSSRVRATAASLDRGGPRTAQVVPVQPAAMSRSIVRNCSTVRIEVRIVRRAARIFMLHWRSQIFTWEPCDPIPVARTNEQHPYRDVPESRIIHNLFIKIMLYALLTH